ncbi:MAG TPA: radical SAM protein [Anaeromyxobacteraceae bacterium]|jgi:MoaA/NifB/PqqE/SkfB family radical SAM enzyme
MHSPIPHIRSLFWKRRPIHLTYFVTRRCNAACPFCFYAEARDAEGGAPELSAAEVERVARSLGDLLWVLFSGGEPFLRDDLAEVSRVFHDTNRAAFLTYPTNGLLPEVVVGRTEEILRSCGTSVVVVKLSLDGVGRDHDALRQVPGGFDRAMRAYEGLASLARRNPRLELGINTLFCPENQWRIDEVIDFVRGLEGVRSHTITMVRGRPGDGTSGEVDLGQYRRATRRLEEQRPGPRRLHRFAGGGLKAVQDRLQRRLVHRTLVERRRVVPCYAGRLSLVLTESGELFPCEGRWDRSFGNVREAGWDVAGMLRSERGRRILDEVAEGGCHCSHECNLLTSILFNPMMHPRLLGGYVADRGRRLLG